MIYSGIDLHKTNMVITTIDNNGQVLTQRNLTNRKNLVKAYFNGFDGPHRAVVESTDSWYWLSDLLGGMNVDLRLAHALQLKAISYAKVKTDTVDSAMRLLREVMHARLRLVVRRMAAE